MADFTSLDALKDPYNSIFPFRRGLEMWLSGP